MSIRIHEEFMTRDKAIAYAEATRKAFPATKFGTCLTVRRTHCRAFWEVAGHRFA